MSAPGFAFTRGELSLGEKLAEINWAFVLLLCLIASIGFAVLYSAANGSFQPWASRQTVRFGFGLALMIAVALVDIRVWLRIAYPVYFAALAMLCIVEFSGSIGMGAQRWLEFGPIQLQPSEIMKIALILALARYFHGLTMEETERYTSLIWPLLLIAAPAFLVLRQPDLGTALLMCFAGLAILFLSGVRAHLFVALIPIGIAAAVTGWNFLRDYQRDRILTFLDPERDPLGAGYHILQSKIALGSGGMSGKGYMQGTQSHLNFLPEQQTDFIFTMFGEEFGLIGGLILLTLYVVAIIYGYSFALQSRNHFGRLMALGLNFVFFLYVFINVAMVMGLVPVVGVPLPLVSYGGTSMLTLLVGFGLIMNVYVHRNAEFTKTGARIRGRY